jgi:glycosyltransferase involved in cell wall biosynthesis
VRLGFSLVTVRPGQVGGAETYAKDLLAAFRAGYGPEEVVVLANPGIIEAYHGLVDPTAADVAVIPGLDPRTGPVRRTATLLGAACRPGLVDRVVPDLDLVHYPVIVPLPRTRRPTVVTLHDVQHRVRPEFFSPAQRAYRAVAYDRAARRADLVITDSNHSKSEILEALQLDERKVVTIPLGIDHGRFCAHAPKADDVRRIGELGITGPFVFYPANLWGHKNHARLIEALALTKTDAHLVLTGATYGREQELAELATRLGLGDRVQHLGRVGSEAIPALYRQAAAVVFPTLYEGFGAPPLEAMACGCPCVISTHPTVLETTGGIGVSVNPTDPEDIAQGIDQVLQDEVLRGRLIEAGLAHAARFTWEDAARRHVAAYESVL